MPYGQRCTAYYGKEWKLVNDFILKAVHKWNLRNLDVIYQNSRKAIYSAVSDDYGDVILKCDRISQLFTEYRMLSRLSGKGSAVCQVLGFDAENGLLLEERILPGTVLRREPSPEKRIRIFLQIFRKIHTPEHDGETYLDWLSEIREFCKNNPVEPELSEMAEEAYAICAEMFEKYPERVLLHGDLHHDNILLRADGTYAMIDPKGVIGPEIFDIPRFLLNELDTMHSKPDAEHIEETIVRLSENLGYSQEDIRRLFYMETVLANLWSYEDGEPINHEQLMLAEKIKTK